MDKAAELKKLLRVIVGFQNSLPIPAKVVKIDGDSCSVEIDSLVLTDVKLKATISEETDHLLITPKVGTNVLLMSLTGELDNLTVVKVDEVQSIHFKQNGLEFLVDGSDGKVSVKNNDTSLLDLFGELKELISAITVSTGVGPSGTPLPPTIQSLTLFEQNFKKLLK